VIARAGRLIPTDEPFDLQWPAAPHRLTLHAMPNFPHRHLQRLASWTLATLIAATYTLSICTPSFAATPVQIPPLGGSGPIEHHPGKIIWADLVTPDLAAAETFYAGLFHWTFQTVQSSGTQYAVAMLDGRPVAGILQKPIAPDEHRQAAWLTFIATRDVDTTERRARQNGAQSVAPAKTYQSRGRQAVLKDPEGAVFAVLASSSGDPPDFLAAPGEWIWSSLLSNDPASSAAFYKAVFGYDVFEVAADEPGHLILSSDDYARMSINRLPADGHRHAHFMDFIRVTDVPETVATAASLGGRVLVEPFVDRHGGRIAVIADPAGAPIGLMEWVQSDSQAEPK
jgi:predicted enzyme related to lactoylglutathione lyase